MLPGSATPAAVQCSFGDRDKSRGALLSEGKHYLRVKLGSSTTAAGEFSFVSESGVVFLWDLN